MALHQAMINSIGALNLATIERLSGHVGIISLSCRILLAHITVIFGTLHASDVFFIENHIKEELSSFAGFRDFVSCQSQTRSITISLPRFRIKSVRSPRYNGSKILCSDARSSDIPIGTWKSTNTSVATRTYNDLMQYLATQYSSLSPDTPSRGGKAFGISDGPNTNNRGQGKNKKRRRGKGKGGGSNDSDRNSNPKRQK
jgi:hypothetical protein